MFLFVLIVLEAMSEVLGRSPEHRLARALLGLTARDEPT